MHKVLQGLNASSLQRQNLACPAHQLHWETLMGVGEGYSMRSWYMVYVKQIMRFTPSTEHAVFVRSA